MKVGISNFPSLSFYNTHLLFKKRSWYTFHNFTSCLIKVFYLLLFSTNVIELLQYRNKSYSVKNLGEAIEKISASEIMNATIEFVEDGNDNVCSNENCHSEIHQLLLQYSVLEKKIAEAKDRYHSNLTENLKKDIIIEKLEKELKDHRYSSFRNVFTATTIAELQSMEESQKKDTAFITIAVKGLYRNDLNRLMGKNSSGRTKKIGSKKEPMSPEKIKLIEKLFDERLRSATDHTSRKNNLKRSIRTALETINKKQSK